LAKNVTFNPKCDISVFLTESIKYWFSRIIVGIGSGDDLIGFLFLTFFTTRSLQKQFPFHPQNALLQTYIQLTVTADLKGITKMTAFLCIFTA
jgi:hypothetical protein